MYFLEISIKCLPRFHDHCHDCSGSIVDAVVTAGIAVVAVAGDVVVAVAADNATSWRRRWRQRRVGVVKRRSVKIRLKNSN